MSEDLGTGARRTQSVKPSPTPTQIDTWKIHIVGYGTFEFRGTEAEAEERRACKALWEMGAGHKWRVTNQTEPDKIVAKMCALWDQGKGVPAKMALRLSRARAARTKAAASPEECAERQIGQPKP